MARASGAAVVVSAVVLASLVVAAPVRAAGPGTVVLASHTAVGPTTAPVGASEAAVTSADGNYVAFVSTATNLVSGQSDPNGGARDVFLYNRQTGTVTLVSHASGSATTTGGGESFNPSISSNGAFVAFESKADNLVPGQSDPKGNLGHDVFLYTRATGNISLVSHSTVGATTAGNDSAHNPSISADGSFVAFDSYATTLVSGTDPVSTNDVFLYARATGAITLVSHTPTNATTTANGASEAPRVSADGNYVAFESMATNLVGGQTDANLNYDVFLWSRSSGAVTLVSHVPANATTTAQTRSLLWSISGNGDFVAFSGNSNNLVAGQVDPDGNADIFLYDRVTGVVSLVSHTPASATTAGNALSSQPFVSNDGAFVAFVSWASNLVTGTDTNNIGDVFLYTRATGAVTLVSHVPASSTTAGNAESRNPSISSDGSFVSFASLATNLVSGQTDTNSGNDVFLWTRSTGTLTLVSHTAASATTTGNGASDRPSLSADGRFAAFLSSASNLVTSQSDGNGADDVFLFSRTGNGVGTAADFDGDGDSEISVFRPSSGVWYVGGSSPSSVTFGVSGDVPVPADYDGDGNVDQAVFRPSDGVWYLNTTPGQAVPFGTSTDIPVPADYDGDGDADIAVFRPSSGVWYVRTPATSTVFGANGDIPVPGDYDGNGRDEFAVFRPSTGVWYLNGPPAASPVFGASGDIPVPGDYNDDGRTDLAVFRPSNSVWYIQSPASSVVFGAAGDQPQPGDYNGDGRTDIAVFRPSNSVWYIHSPGSSTVFGASGDVPLVLPNAIRRFFFT